MTGTSVLLDAVQARVLAVLVEKRYTVPDTYPLSLLSLVSGCNQRSSRDPVMDLSEVQVQGALDALRLRSFVIESSGSRVMRYAENVGLVLGVPREAVALLAVLMLRGPQTAAELRLHSERLHRFADASSVEAFLEELANRSGLPLVRRLPVQPGSREARWTHTLTSSASIPGNPGVSPVAVQQAAAANATLVRAASGDLAAPVHNAGPGFISPATDTALLERLARLEQQVDALHGEVAALRTVLSSSFPREPSP